MSSQLLRSLGFCSDAELVKSTVRDVQKKILCINQFKSPLSNQTAVGNKSNQNGIGLIIKFIYIYKYSSANLSEMDFASELFMCSREYVPPEKPYPDT